MGTECSWRQRPRFINSYRRRSASTCRHWGTGGCQLPWVLGTWPNNHIWYAYYEHGCSILLEERICKSSGTAWEGEEGEVSPELSGNAEGFYAYGLLCVDSQKSLTGEDRLCVSGTTNKVAWEKHHVLVTRNNTDRQLDRLINWQYFLPLIKLFYILPTMASTPSTDGIKVWAQHCLNSEVHFSCCICHWVHKSLNCTKKRPACYCKCLSSTFHHLCAFWPTIRTQEKGMSSPLDVTKLLQVHRGSSTRFVKFSNGPNTNSECSNLLN